MDILNHGYEAHDIFENDEDGEEDQETETLKNTLFQNSFLEF